MTSLTRLTVSLPPIHSECLWPPQVPVTVAFQANFPVLTAVMDALFVLDVLSKFFIPKYHHGAVIVKPREIAWTYLCGGNFFMDMMAAYPMDR